MPRNAIATPNGVERPGKGMGWTKGKESNHQQERVGALIEQKDHVAKVDALLS